jgi:hypothetical protein
MLVAGAAAAAAEAPQRCRLREAGGPLLELHDFPAGPVVRLLRGGQWVRRIDTDRDGRGRQWVRIARLSASGALTGRGWLLASEVLCPGDQEMAERE